MTHINPPGSCVLMHTNPPGWCVYHGDMRDDEIRHHLRERNPWWRSSAGNSDALAWSKIDTTLAGADQFDLKYQPAVLSDLVEGGLYVVRGPRRVGKSVTIKRLIADQLSNNISPLQIIYLPLDEFDARGLRRALRLGRELTSAIGEKPRFWFLDEVTAVKNWPMVLKSARDDTSFGLDTVVVTGSSAHGLTEARRALGAGRVGPVRDPFRLLLPMTFRDFVAATKRDLPEIPVVGPSELQSPTAEKAVKQLIPFVDEIDLAWQTYCEVGGFPRAVGEYLMHGAVSESFNTDLIDWLAPDVTPYDPPESITRLLSTVGMRMTSALNVVVTAENVGISRERLRTQLNRLVSTFAALWCPQVDDRSTPVRNSQSKLYLLDPLLSRLPTLVETGLSTPDMTARSEAALALCLARSIDAAHPGRLLEGHAIGFTRSKSGREIDFAPLPMRVAGQETTSVPVECRWVSRLWRSQALAMENRYQRGVMATKDILDLSHPVWAVPAGAVALLLS